jgi:hypothetical protein
MIAQAKQQGVGGTLATLSRVLGACVGLCLPAVACGARTGLLVPSEEYDASCVGADVPLSPKVPNLYFVLDVSKSMADANKWDNVRTVVGNLLGQLGPSAAFGAAVFPWQGNEDACARGAEVMPLRRGDTQGITQGIFLQATDNITPNGGTPTAPTLEALASELESFHGPTFVILATDGGPNCNAKVSCDLTTCTSNIDGVSGCPTAGPSCCDPSNVGNLRCLDGDRTVQVVASLHAHGIRTFVLGIPGSAAYGDVLDAAATAGGTVHYYRVDNGPKPLGDALGEIAAQTMASCVFSLTELPADPNEVNVSLGGSVIPQRGPDGWTLNGTQLTLLGASCAAIQNPSAPLAPPVAVTQGCATFF